MQVWLLANIANRLLLRISDVLLKKHQVDADLSRPFYAQNELIYSHKFVFFNSSEIYLESINAESSSSTINVQPLV